MEHDRRHQPELPALAFYKTLFVNRVDTYARQQDNDRSYYRVKEPLTDAVLTAHLRGDVTIGLYSLGQDGKSRWGCIDSDQGEQVIFDIRDELQRKGVLLYVERSRQGAHGWIFLAEPLPGFQIKTILEHYARGLEVFPSPSIPDEAGFGLLVRGPLGVHRYNGERYSFLDGNGAPVSSGVCLGQLAWLQENVQRVDLRTLAVPDHAPRLPEQRVIYPEAPLSPIRAFNESHPIREVVGQYVSLNRSGVGHCPWGENHKQHDRHRSFQVFDRTQKWWCYTERIGGDAFSFLCRYHNLSPKEMLRKLQE